LGTGRVAAAFVLIASLACAVACLTCAQNPSTPWQDAGVGGGDDGPSAEVGATRNDATTSYDAGAVDATTGIETGIDSGERDGATGGGSDGGGCGYQGRGTALHVATGIDVCLAPAVCTSETCPPGAGKCVGGSCAFTPGYEGIATLPQAWATYYCDLTSSGCNGVTQVNPPQTTAQKVAAATGFPLCTASPDASTCAGISAAPPVLVGNSQLATDPATQMYVKDWGLGLTEASGLCYKITGPGGTAVVALTDRCGGFCQCNGSAFEECGSCVSAPDMHPDCPCVGTVPGLYTNCCGRTCVATPSPCDWCASNNHAHFDLDIATFNVVCGSQSALGSCQLTRVSTFPCLPPTAWPP
jgi:hypothetical protein